MRINLISRDNGMGLTQDIAQMTKIFTSLGHTTAFVNAPDECRPADVNFYLELFAPKYLDAASKHVGIFNPEWFDPAWTEYLPRFTQIWAKSSVALEQYVEHGLTNAVYTGFASADLFDPTIVRQRRVLHVRGTSGRKGTEAVIEAYRRESYGLLPLTIISDSPICDSHMPNVEQYIGRISHAKLTELYNSHMFHLCPSSYEGWGHYIAEAAGCKAIVITTNASPMNEHILSTFGYLIEPTLVQNYRGIRHHFIDVDGIVNALEMVSSVDDETLSMMRQRARVWSGIRRTLFLDKAVELINKLLIN